MGDVVQIIEVVMGPLGMLLATAMFSSSYPVIKDIRSRGNVGEYSYFPYLVQVCNCSLWDLYSLADYGGGKMLWPLLANVVGLIISGLSYFMYFLYADPKTKCTICAVTTPLLLLIYGCGIFILITGQKDLHDELTNAEGIFTLIANTAMYTGPLAGVAYAIKNKSVEFLPLSLGLTTLTCSAPWLVYGVAIANMAIIVPNACGVVFGPVQMVVYCCVSKSNKTENDEMHKFQRLE